MPSRSAKSAASPGSSADVTSASRLRVAAITGGVGFIGKHLVASLLQNGAETRVLTGSGARLKGDDFRSAGDRLQYFRTDLTDPDPATLDRLCAGADVVFHLAGLVSRKPEDNLRMMQLHVDGTRHLLDAVEHNNVKRVVLLSTSGVVGVSRSSQSIANDDSPYAMELALRWPYYASKIYQEKLAMDRAERWKTDGRDLRLVALRPSLVLGPGDDRGSSTGDVLRFLQRKFPAIPAGGLSFVDARDAALACRLAAALPEERFGISGARSYLLGAANWSFRRYMETLRDLSGAPLPGLELPPQASVLGARLWSLTGDRGRRIMDLDPESADMANHFWYIDSSRAESELGWKARPPRETLADTIADLRSRDAVAG